MKTQFLFKKIWLVLIGLMMAASTVNAAISYLPNSGSTYAVIDNGTLVTTAWQNSSPGTTTIGSDSYLFTNLTATTGGWGNFLVWRYEPSNSVGYMVYNLRLKAGKSADNVRFYVTPNAWPDNPENNASKVYWVKDYATINDTGNTWVVIPWNNNTSWTRGAIIDPDGALLIKDFYFCTSQPTVPSTCDVEPPTGLDSSSTSSTVSLSWNASAGASGYFIYRSTDGSAFTKLNVTAEAGTTYTDASAAAGTVYYYKVSAVGTDGCEAQTSAITASTCNSTAYYISGAQYIRGISGAPSDNSGQWRIENVGNTNRGNVATIAANYPLVKPALGNVGYISGGDWGEYYINPCAAGQYTITLWIALNNTSTIGGTIRTEGGATQLGTFSATAQNDYQIYSQTTATVTLPAGPQVIRIAATSSMNFLGMILEPACTTPATAAISASPSSVCPGSQTTVTVSDPQTNVTYALYNGAQEVGSPTKYTGTAISWNVTVADATTYTLKSVLADGFCAIDMGTATVSSTVATPVIDDTMPVCRGDLNTELSFGSNPANCYWQTTAGGTDMTYPAFSGTFLREDTSLDGSGTTYYLRMNVGGCWSAPAEVLVTNGISGGTEAVNYVQTVGATVRTGRSALVGTTIDNMIDDNDGTNYTASCSGCWDRIAIRLDSPQLVTAIEFIVADEDGYRFWSDTQGRVWTAAAFGALSTMNNSNFNDDRNGNANDVDTGFTRIGNSTLSLIAGITNEAGPVANSRKITLPINDIIQVLYFRGIGVKIYEIRFLGEQATPPVDCPELPVARILKSLQLKWTNQMVTDAQMEGLSAVTYSGLQTDTGGDYMEVYFELNTDLDSSYTAETVTNPGGNYQVWLKGVDSTPTSPVQLGLGTDKQGLVSTYYDFAGLNANSGNWTGLLQVVKKGATPSNAKKRSIGDGLGGGAVVEEYIIEIDGIATNIDNSGDTPNVLQDCFNAVGQGVDCHKAQGLVIERYTDGSVKKKVK